MDLWSKILCDSYYLEAITIVAAIFELLGIYYLGKKKKRGFTFGAISCILWIAYVAITRHTLGLLIICSAAIFLNFKGYNHWKINGD